MNTAFAPRISLTMAMGLVLLLASQASLIMASGRWYVVAPWIALTLAAPFVAHRLRWNEPKLMGYLLMALPLALLARAWPVMTRGLDTSLAFYVSLFLQCVALVGFYARDAKLQVQRLVGCSGITLAACGTDVEFRPYLVLVVIYGSALPLVLRGSLPRPATREGRRSWAVRGVVAGAFVAAVGMSIGTSIGIDATYHDLQRLYMKLRLPTPPAGSGGFSNQAKLGDVMDVKAKGRGQIAVRAYGAAAPGYLRAQVFFDYRDGEWTADADAGEAAVRVTTDAGRHQLTGRPITPADAER
ncbi:hypothetical protein OAX78_04270, partial [Planctomycetota bacterium]|nr:hypothetical protein [Planctomycetota bacterium]